MPEMERQATERCFERLFGFAERSYAPTRAALLRVAQFEWYNGRERCLLDLPCGRVSSGWHSAPSVRELRDDVIQLAQKARPTRGESWWSSVVQTYSHVVGESTQLHSAHPGGVFQAASQFNLLEFIDPEVVPEDGIANYIYDRTQGPACAVACLAGTAYRNYLIHPSFVSGEPLRSSEAVDSALRGQRHDWQANMLADVTAFISGPHPTRGESTLGPVDASQLYTIRNGYFHASTEQSQRLHQRLCAVAASRVWSMDQLMDELSDLVRVGVVEETPVTHPLPKGSSVMHVVTQTYNSALSLPPSYATKGEGSNEDGVALLAQTVLNGSYEATLLCAARSTLNLLPTPGSSGEWKPPPTFLTKVGGGVFHNPQRWIQRAIARARTRMRTLDVPMDVRLVHFGQLDQSFVELAYSD